MINRALYARRRLANSVFIVLSISAAIFGLIWLAFILGSLLSNGVAALTPTLFTMSTPPPGEAGGLLNAIVGSLVMCSLAMVAALAVGILAGTWLAEYGEGSKLAATVRFLNDVLLSAPSILVGLFVYQVIVSPFGGFSGIAGCLAALMERGVDFVCCDNPHATELTLHIFAAVAQHEGGVHGRNGHQALDHRVADQMGEADLATVGPEQLIVDDGAVDL